MQYPKELFRGDQYRVVFSGEEHEQMKAAGWSDEREPGKAYRVHTAVAEAPAQEPEPAPSPEPSAPSADPAPADKSAKPAKNKKAPAQESQPALNPEAAS